jgi:hypothetical protein
MAKYNSRVIRGDDRQAIHHRQCPVREPLEDIRRQRGTVGLIKYDLVISGIQVANQMVEPGHNQVRVRFQCRWAGRDQAQFCGEGD